MKVAGGLQQWFYFSLCLMIAFGACRPVKKVQRIGNVITTKDTASRAVTQPEVIDSAVIIKGIVNKLEAQRIDFKTFSAKVKIDYVSSDGSDGATAYLRMQKDSIIWLSLTGALGIEGFRVLITRDSVKLMNKLEKVIQYRRISYLQELTGVPVDFNTLQDILIGNPVYIDSNIISYQVSSNNLLLLMSGRIFKNLLTLDTSNLRLLHSKLDDINPLRNRTADITYNNYSNEGRFYFSTYRNISIAEKTKLDVMLEFKQYDFDKAQNFPFNIPKSYRTR